MALDGINGGRSPNIAPRPKPEAPRPPPTPARAEPQRPPQGRSTFEQSQARGGPSLDGAPTSAAQVSSTPPGSPGQTNTPAEAPKPQAPSYTQEQADRDAAALHDATLGGVTGWGTDEDKVFKTLEGKSPEQIALIRKSFQDHYQKNLDNVLRDEMSGADRKHVEALLQGDAAKSDAVTIQAEMDGVFGSSEEILKTLEGKSPEERHAIAQEYAAMNGGAPAGKSPEDFMLSKLEKELDPGEMSRARNLLGASQAKSPAEASALELQSLKEGLAEDMDGWGTDEGRIFDRLEKATPEQRQALLGDKELVGRLEDELSKEDYSRAMGLLQGNQAQADAARIRESMNGFFGADEKGVRGVLEGKTPEQLNAIKAEYQKQTGRSLESDVKSWGGSDAEVTLRLLNPPKEGDTKAQAEASAERLHLAMDGMGTDEDALRAELGDKSKAELDAIATAYKEKYGKDLRQELDGELDGRDQFELLEQSYDLGAIDPNDPNAAQERVRRLRAQQENEKGFGTWVLDNVQRGIKGESDNDRLNRNLDAADKAIQSGDTQRAQTLTGYATDDVKSLQASKDSLADTAATVGVAVVTTAAVVATGGAATPLAIAGYAALGATTRAATYAAFQGNAAGGQDLGRQALIGAAEGATVVLPVGKGVTALNSAARTGATTAVKETAENTLLTAAKQGFKEGAVGGATGGAVDAATRSETWDNGFANGLRQVATQAAVDGLVGATTGGLTSAGMTRAAQAFQPREIPVVRNPELTGNTTRVRYDNGRVHVEAGPRATPADIQAHMETARTLQKYEGPIGQIRRMRDRIQQTLTGMPGHGTQGFESRLEVKKLQGILASLEGVQQRIDNSIRGVSSRPSPATLAEREALQREISSVESQLRTHEAQVDSLAPGRGFVAKEGSSIPAPDWVGVGTPVNTVGQVNPPSVGPKTQAESDAIDLPRGPNETKAEAKARQAQGWKDYAERTYDPKTRTQAELNRDVKPSTYPGEAQQYASHRVRLAEEELLRRGVIREQQLQEAFPHGPTLDMSANDAAHHSHGAHTNDRHGPSIPLGASSAPGAKSIESRVINGDGWGGMSARQPRSFRWENDAVMNQTINDHIKANWAAIREELALNGFSERLDIPAPPGTVVGRGFVEGPQLPNGNYTAIPATATSYNIRLRLIDGTPPEIMVLTAFPGP